MLIGNSSAGMFLVCAENVPNPYVLPRPFRINAGGVHSYCRMPGGRTASLRLAG
jgi:3-dehydroquinate synthase II